MMSQPEVLVSANADSARRTDDGKGVLAGLVAYTLWGFLPLLFHAVDAVGSVMVVADRTLSSLVLLTVIMIFAGGFGEVRALFRDRRRVLGTLVSALVLASNWLLYIWAVESGQVLEASFGYFINPLINVVMGMVLLGERQNRVQLLAIAISAIGIAIQAAGLGQFPFIAVGLAATFAFYGYCRKTAQLGPASGLFAETAMLAPLAVAVVIYGLATSGPGAHADPQTLILLALTGPATAVPLLLFAYSVRRLRLTTIGMLQYISPSIQFLVAILMFGEHLNGLRLFSFVVIWISLMLFSYDSFRRRARTTVAV